MVLNSLLDNISCCGWANDVPEVVGIILEDMSKLPGRLLGICSKVPRHAIVHPSMLTERLLNAELMLIGCSLECLF